MSATFDLKARLLEMKLEPKKALGQNFLINPEVIGRIVAAVKDLNKQNNFTKTLEIGPGLGALTEPLLLAGITPELIELDPDLVAYWRGRDLNVTDGDALKVNWDSLVTAAPTLLVSNLPYHISTHLVVDRCAGPAHLTHMILMFQKEVAQRLMAEPRTKEYGLLSVMAQWHFEMRKVADAAPRDFFPPPKIASRVVEFRRRPNLGWDPRRLTFLRGAFAFRRKFLLKNLKAVVDKSKHISMRETLIELGFSEKARAEELAPPQLMRIFEKIYGN